MISMLSRALASRRLDPLLPNVTFFWLRETEDCCLARVCLREEEAAPTALVLGNRLAVNWFGCFCWIFGRGARCE